MGRKQEEPGRRVTQSRVLSGQSWRGRTGKALKSRKAGLQPGFPHTINNENSNSPRCNHAPSTPPQDTGFPVPIQSPVLVTKSKRVLPRRFGPFPTSPGNFGKLRPRCRAHPPSALPRGFRPAASLSYLRPPGFRCRSDPFDRRRRADRAGQQSGRVRHSLCGCHGDGDLHRAFE